MRSTRTIQECIKDPSKTNEINEFIARGRSEGNQTFDQHLLDLIRASKVSVETALGAATNPMDLKTKLSLEGGDPEAVDDVEPTQDPFEIESDTRF
jgi:twitching motility protein PilT